jgi:transposase-like protein
LSNPNGVFIIYLTQMLTRFTHGLSFGAKSCRGRRRAEGLGVGRVMLDLDSAHFRDEHAARLKLESLRWPSGVQCCHCGAIGTARNIASNLHNRVRAGLYRCGSCGRQFTVTVGTVFESSHIPLHKWLQAIHLLFSANKPVSAKLIERTLDVTYKTAWIMVQRLRAAERRGRANDVRESPGADRPLHRKLLASAGTVVDERG